jgi:hypothetical protein
MNLVAIDKHVPEIELHICTLKECTQCIYNTLPFEHMAPCLIIEMVYTSSFWLNAFPYQHGISDVLSPCQIVTGSTIDFNRHCCLAFGIYFQTHKVHDNTMIPRTIGDLALGPTGNAQHGFYFYSLNSGRVISRNCWTEVPMPNEIIERVDSLARRANAAHGPLAFLNRFGFPIDDEVVVPDDASFIPDADDNTNDDTDDDNADADDADDLVDTAVPIALAADFLPPGADHIFDIDGALPNPDQIPVRIENSGVDDIMDDTDGFPEVVETADIPGVDDVDDLLEIVEIADIPGVEEHDSDVEPALETPGVDAIDVQMNKAYGERTSQYNLCPRRERNYDHLFTQHSIKKGLQVFVDAGAAAVIKELNQMHDLQVIVPVDPKLLTRDDKSNALQYLMFLKQK